MYVSQIADVGNKTLTEEYGHIADAFDNLPEEELLMTDEQIRTLRNLIKDEIEFAQIDGMMTEQKGDFFVDKETNALYIFNGNKWLEVVLTS